MQQKITSDVFGVLNLTTGDEYIRVEQTAPGAEKSEQRFPLVDAADIALRVLYLLLKDNKKAVLQKSPFYAEVKKML